MKYLRRGLALLFPLALVIFVLQWLYKVSFNVTQAFLPEQQWWYPIFGFIGLLIFIFLIGLIFSLIKPLKWAFRKIENWIIGKIPGVNALYAFGKELSDAFLSDVKGDGDLPVVSVEMLGGVSLGVLIDKEHNTVFVPTAPNPTNGFLLRTTQYKIIDTMKYTEAIKFVTSIGKLNGDKW